MSKSVKMKKNNRILDVENSRAASFLMQGYDQIDENGNIVIRATGGRTVSLAEHNQVLEQNDTLKAEVKELKAGLKKADTTKKDDKK